MKLIRVGEPGRETPGVLLDDGRRISAAATLASVGQRDYDESFFAGDAIDAVASWVAAGVDGDVLDDIESEPLGGELIDKSLRTGIPQQAVGFASEHFRLVERAAGG